MNMHTVKPLITELLFKGNLFKMKSIKCTNSFPHENRHLFNKNSSVTMYRNLFSDHEKWAWPRLCTRAVTSYDIVIN